jgi:hypothetical protein
METFVGGTLTGGDFLIIDDSIKRWGSCCSMSHAAARRATEKVVIEKK